MKLEDIVMEDERSEQAPSSSIVSLQLDLVIEVLRDIDHNLPTELMREIARYVGLARLTLCDKNSNDYWRLSNLLATSKSINEQCQKLIQNEHTTLVLNRPSAIDQCLNQSPLVTLQRSRTVELAFSTEDYISFFNILGACYRGTHWYQVGFVERSLRRKLRDLNFKHLIIRIPFPKTPRAIAEIHAEHDNDGFLCPCSCEYGYAQALVDAAMTVHQRAVGILGRGWDVKLFGCVEDFW